MAVKKRYRIRNGLKLHLVWGIVARAVSLHIYKTVDVMVVGLPFHILTRL